MFRRTPIQICRILGPVTETVVYTVPEDGRTLLNSIVLTNFGTVTSTARVTISGLVIVPDTSLPAKTSLALTDLGHVMTSGATVTISAAVADTVNFAIAGLGLAKYS